MEKSFNDIGGKYIENAARRVNVQHFTQIAARPVLVHPEDRNYATTALVMPMLLTEK